MCIRNCIECKHFTRSMVLYINRCRLNDHCSIQNIQFTMKSFIAVFLATAILQVIVLQFLKHWNFRVLYLALSNGAPDYMKYNTSNHNTKTKRYFEYFQLTASVSCDNGRNVGHCDSIFNPKVCTCGHPSTSNVKQCDKKQCDTEFNRNWDNSFQNQICDDSGSSYEGIAEQSNLMLKSIATLFGLISIKSLNSGRIRIQEKKERFALTEHLSIWKSSSTFGSKS